MTKIIYINKSRTTNNNTEIQMHLDNKKYISFDLSNDDDPLSIVNELCEVFTNLDLNVKRVSEDLKTLLNSRRIKTFYY